MQNIFVLSVGLFTLMCIVFCPREAKKSEKKILRWRRLWHWPCGVWGGTSALSPQAAPRSWWVRSPHPPWPDTGAPRDHWCEPQGGDQPPCHYRHICTDSAPPSWENTSDLSELQKQNKCNDADVMLYKLGLALVSSSNNFLRSFKFCSTKVPSAIHCSWLYLDLT